MEANTVVLHQNGQRKAVLFPNGAPATDVKELVALEVGLPLGTFKLQARDKPGKPTVLIDAMLATYNSEFDVVATGPAGGAAGGGVAGGAHGRFYGELHAATLEADTLRLPDGVNWLDDITMGRSI